MSKAEFTRQVRKNLKSKVTVDSALAELLNYAGYYNDKDIDVLWAACHMLVRLGLVELRQRSTKMGSGTEMLHTAFLSKKKLRKLMVYNGHLSQGDI